MDDLGCVITSNNIYIILLGGYSMKLLGKTNQNPPVLLLLPYVLYIQLTINMFMAMYNGKQIAVME